jgi:8-oxo-dGTP diphosphatase
MNFTQNILITVDAVLFGYQRAEGIIVLLIRRKEEPYIHHWALPGGFVRYGETLEAAVYRELHEEAGLAYNYLEQLYTYGAPERDPRQRIISVAYYGLVRPEFFSPVASSDAEEAAWFKLRNLPALAFDHSQIIKAAFERLKGKITYEPIGFRLLDEKFPFSDLEHLYMTVLEREIDRRNFKRKIMKLGVVEELPELVASEGAGRPAHLYRFNAEKFQILKQTGLIFDILV